MSQTTPNPLLMSLFPAIALVDPNLLFEIQLLEANLDAGAADQEDVAEKRTLALILKDVLDGCEAHSAVQSILFGGEGKEEIKEEDTRRVLDRLARTMVGCLGVSSLTLQESSLNKNNSLVCFLSIATIRWVDLKDAGLFPTK